MVSIIFMRIRSFIETSRDRSVSPFHWLASIFLSSLPECSSHRKRRSEVGGFRCFRATRSNDWKKKYFHWNSLLVRAPTNDWRRSAISLSLSLSVRSSRMAPEVIACDENPQATYDNRVRRHSLSLSFTQNVSLCRAIFGRWESPLLKWPKDNHVRVLFCPIVA